MSRSLTLAFVDRSDCSVELALEPTVLWCRYAAARVAVIYRGRSLPLAWVVLEQSRASVALSKFQHLLHQAAQLLPRHGQVTLPAERGFNDVDLMAPAVKLGWHFILRLKTSLWVYRSFKTVK